MKQQLMFKLKKVKKIPSVGIMPASRVLTAIVSLVLLTGCFQIAQVLDWKDDGTMDVVWTFKFSKSLEKLQSNDGKEKKDKKSLSSRVEEGREEMRAKLKNLVKDLEVKSVENEFDSGMVLSFTVPDFANFPYDKLEKDEFPVMPQYIPSKRQVVFNFEPIDKDKKSQKAKDSSKADNENTEQAPQSNGSTDEMTKQLTGLFLSSVRYQIYLSKKFNPERVYLKKGKEEKNIELQKFLDIYLIDLPVFSIFGEKEEPFQMVIQLK